MKIIKVLNTSALILEDKKCAMLAFGKGIGFSRKVGEEFSDKQKIEKIYELKDTSKKNEYLEVIENAPVQNIELVQNILERAEKEIEEPINSSVFVPLLDHVTFSYKRYKEGIYVENKLSDEIHRLYPKEYNVGLYAVEKINTELGINLPEEEAGNIAFHLVNAHQCATNTILNVFELSNIIKEIVAIIEYEYGMKIDKTTFNYSRLVTHLKFFIYRVLEPKEEQLLDEKMHLLVKEQYQKEYQCAKKIVKYITIKLKDYRTDFEICNSELVYLTLHVNRLFSR